MTSLQRFEETPRHIVRFIRWKTETDPWKKVAYKMALIFFITYDLQPTYPITPNPEKIYESYTHR